MIYSSLVDPFIAGDLPLLVAAAKALHTVLVQCWPRIRGSVLVYDALDVITICWTNLQASGAGRNIEIHTVAEAAVELRHTAKILLELTLSSEKAAQLVVDRLVATAPELRDLITAEPPVGMHPPLRRS